MAATCRLGSTGQANLERNMKTPLPLPYWFQTLFLCAAAALFGTNVRADGSGTGDPLLINVNFGGHLTPAGLDINKVGLAAMGQTTNDLWNFYSRDVAPGQWRQDGSIPNLLQADGSLTEAGLLVNNLPGAWYNGSSDAMYNGFLYPQSGPASVVVTNLPAGRYDFFLYSGQGNFQLRVETTNYGTLTTYDVPVTSPPVWQAGVQYACFTNVQLAAGNAVTVTLLPGAGGGPSISGMQIYRAALAPGVPTISAPPTGQTVFEGADVVFQVTVTGDEPLSYQWSFNGTNLPSATGTRLVVPGVGVGDAGNYSVTITNRAGAITSPNAPLTVVRFASNALINVNFGGHLTPEGLNSNKTGLAAIGRSTNDLWNFYSRDSASGEWKRDGALSNLQQADGTITAAGLEVQNLPGAWYNTAVDTMYHGFLYPQSGSATLLVTNLPAGQYDVYLYSGQGAFQMLVGAADYGILGTHDAPLANPQMWREGLQYVRFAGVQVAAGQTMTIRLLRGAGGAATVSGLQIAAANALPSSTQYRLHAVTAGGGIVLPDPLLSVYPLGSSVTLTAQPATGWAFLGWRGHAQGSNPVTSLTMTSDKLAEAVFGTFVLPGISGNGTLSTFPESLVYPYGTTVRFRAQPAAGHYFVGWSGAMTGTVNPQTLTVRSPNGTVTANFAPLPAGRVSLAVLSDGLGRVNVMPRTNTFAIGEVATLKATPDAGQDFMGWSGDASGNDPELIVTMDQSKTITASFTQRPRLSASPTVGDAFADGVLVSLLGEWTGSYEIESSTNLVDWRPALSVTNAYGWSGFWSYPGADNQPRFYRALKQ